METSITTGPRPRRMTRRNRVISSVAIAAASLMAALSPAPAFASEGPDTPYAYRGSIVATATWNAFGGTAWANLERSTDGWSWYSVAQVAFDGSQGNQTLSASAPCSSTGYSYRTKLTYAIGGSNNFLTRTSSSVYLTC